VAETPPDRYKKILGAVFKEARENAGLSQKQLAEISSVGRSGIVTIEAGERNPCMYTCQLLADGMKVSHASLVEEIVKRFKKTKK
jgi:transcriptional regulator with XRE-family HTH domain